MKNWVYVGSMSQYKPICFLPGHTNHRVLLTLLCQIELTDYVILFALFSAKILRIDIIYNMQKSDWHLNHPCQCLRSIIYLGLFCFSSHPAKSYYLDLLQLDANLLSTWKGFLAHGTRREIAVTGSLWAIPGASLCGWEGAECLSLRTKGWSSPPECGTGQTQGLGCDVSLSVLLFSCAHTVAGNNGGHRVMWGGIVGLRGL